MKVDHIGYLARNKDKSLAAFLKMGYEVVQEYVLDEFRNVHICFVKKDGYVVELVSPNGKESAVGDLMKKYGNAPYHICYEVEDLERSIEELQGQGYFMFNEPHEAVAMSGRRVCFLMHPHMGMVELVEETR